jgi:hypothetical protein
MVGCGVWAGGHSPKTVLARNASKNSGPCIVETHMVTQELQCLPAHALRGGRFNSFRGFGGEAISPIIKDFPIDDRSTVDTFPRIEDQEKVREPPQHHQSFALRAIHNYFLPRHVNELARRISNLRSSMTASHYQYLSTVGTTYTYYSVRSAVSIFSILQGTQIFARMRTGWH